jgi:osmoprotectant transport system permease protein
MTVADYLARRWDTVLGLAIQHIVAVALAVAIATVVGVLLAVLVYRNDRAVTLLLVITSTLFTVPALAYFGILVAIVGLGWTSAISVLTIYALLPIVRNTVTGLREVDPAIVKAATGMGMGRFARLWRIELPLAYPVILSGIRVSTVLIVGVGAIAAYVAGPGLGAEMFSALGAIGSVRAVPQLIVATVAIIVIALILDALLALIGRLTTPQGLR